MDLVDTIMELLFSGSSTTQSAFERIAENIFTMPLPDFSNPNFRALYAIMWALGILISIVTGFIAALLLLGRSRRSIGSSTSIAVRMTFFVQVVVIGTLATPIMHIIVFMADLLSDAAQLAIGHRNEDLAWTNSIVTMFSPSNALDYFAKEGLVWMIDHQVAIIQQAIVVAVLFTSVAFAFSVLGEAGKSIWRIWWAITLTLICVKPALAWIFAIAAWLLQNTPNAGGISISLTTLFLAAICPLVLLYIFGKKVNPSIMPIATIPSGSGMMPTYQQSSGSNIGRPVMQSTNQPSATHEISDQRSSTPRTPGVRRVGVATLAARKGVEISAAHPAGGLALGAGAAILYYSGTRAQKKHSPESVNPPFILEVLPKGTRPSLGRMRDNERRS